MFNSKTPNDIIEEVIRQLLSGAREPINKLASDVSANATQLTFTQDTSSINKDSLIEVDLETFRVWDVTQNAKLATVEPGMNNTVSVAHVGGTICRINPRIPKKAALDALNDELRSLSAPMAGLFAIKSINIEVSSSINEVELDVDDQVLGLLETRIKYADKWSPVDCELNRDADTTEFPSGYSIRPPGIAGTLRVTYAAEFSEVENLNDDIEAVSGLPSSAQDILVDGVLLRLGSLREIKRNFTETQGDTRRPGEVPPSSVVTSFGPVRQRRKERIAEEGSRLYRKYPVIK